MGWTRDECENLVGKDLIWDERVSQITMKVARSDKEFKDPDDYYTEATRVALEETGISETHMEYFSKLCLCKHHIDINFKRRNVKTHEVFLTNEIQEAFDSAALPVVPAESITAPNLDPVRLWFETPLIVNDVKKNTGESIAVNAVVFSSQKIPDAYGSEKKGNKLVFIINGFAGDVDAGEKTSLVTSRFSFEFSEFEEQMTKVISMLEREHSALIRQVVSGLLYFLSTDSEILRRINPDYERAERKARRLTGKARKKAFAGLRARPKMEHYVAGLNLKKLQRRKRELVEKTSSSPESIGNRSRHICRGHWRWQAHGKGWKQHKMVWIDAHERGSTENKTAYVAVK